MALLYGNMVCSSIGDSVLVIDRTYLNQNVIGIINNGNSDVYVVIKKRKGENVSGNATWVNLVNKNDFFAIEQSAKGSVATKDKGEEGLSFIGGNIYPMQQRAPFGYNSLKNCTQFRIWGWKSHPEIDENIKRNTFLIEFLKNDGIHEISDEFFLIQTRIGGYD